MLVDNLKLALDMLCRESKLGGMTAITFLAYRALDSDSVEVDLCASILLSCGRFTHLGIHRCDGRRVDAQPKFGAHPKEKDLLASFVEAWRQYGNLYVPRM